MQLHPLLTTSSLLPNSHHFSMPPWVLSMAPTSLAPHLLKSAARRGTAKAFSHRTALLRVPLTSVSLTCCLDGRGQLLTPPFSTMHAASTCMFLQQDITLLMPVSPRVTRFSSLTGTSGIICVSGNRATAGASFPFLTNLPTNVDYPSKSAHAGGTLQSSSCVRSQRH